MGEWWRLVRTWDLQASIIAVRQADRLADRRVDWVAYILHVYIAEWYFFLILIFSFSSSIFHYVSNSPAPSFCHSHSLFRLRKLRPMETLTSHCHSECHNLTSGVPIYAYITSPWTASRTTLFLISLIIMPLYWFYPITAPSVLPPLSLVHPTGILENLSFSHLYSFSFSPPLLPLTLIFSVASTMHSSLLPYFHHPTSFSLSSTTPSHSLLHFYHSFFSYKPQKISPKFQGTVRELLHKKIREFYIHPQFVSDVMRPMR